MNDKTTKKAVYYICIVALIFCAFCFTGCRTTDVVAGDESLVESRIIVAVNAERNRWITELGEQLTVGLGEVDERINAVEGGLNQVTAAAREYRQFVLTVIAKLYLSQNSVPTVDEVANEVNLDTWDLDRDKDYSGLDRP